MKSKKLVLCILIAMVFSFGIGSTSALADETPVIQDTNTNETNNKDASVAEIVDENYNADTLVNTDNIEDADNIEDVEDVDDTVELEDDEDVEQLVDEETTDLKTISKVKSKETAKTEKTVKATTEAKTTKTSQTTKTTNATKTTKSIAKKTVVKKYTNSELRLLSALIYSEAGNQSYKGKLAVGNVVLNRIKSSAFSHTNTVKEVIYDKKWGIQFSVIKKGSSGTSPISRALNLYDNRSNESGAAKENMLECIKAAKAALNGDNNIGSYLSFNRKSSYLSNKYSNHVIIGDHIFYK
jgi:N-acetylmuramoyl-L-alanine amidase